MPNLTACTKNVALVSSISKFRSSKGIPKFLLTLLVFLLFSLAPQQALAACWNNDCDCNAGCSGSQCTSTWFDNYCTSCDSGEYLSGDSCNFCTGGPLWNVGQGNRRVGKACTGTGTYNTQGAAACRTSVAAGYYLGQACTGTGFSDRSAIACTGGSAWDVGQGNRRVGTSCTGRGTYNSQGKAACRTNGGAGYYLGPACTGTGFSDRSVFACTGGSAWNVGQGNRRLGTACTGTGNTDTQGATACRTTAGIGNYLGPACTGTSTSDRQVFACRTTAPAGYKLGPACDGSGTSDRELIALPLPVCVFNVWRKQDGKIQILCL